jgi:hypothetical protein
MRSVPFRMSLLVSAFVFAFAHAGTTMAQEKAAKAEATRKVLLENDKVVVFENTQRPGDVNPSPPTKNFRVVRVLKGSTLERTHADGKKETMVRKTGDVIWNQPGPGYINKNVGTTDYQTYVVVLK